jgi:phosphotriesterase-related protein
VEDEGMAITVNGPIDPAEVGIALTHEHVFVDLKRYSRPSPDSDTARELDGPVQMNMLGHLRLMDYQNLDNLVLDSYEIAMKELARFRKRGGKTICDVSSRALHDRSVSWNVIGNYGQPSIAAASYPCL